MERAGYTKAATHLGLIRLTRLGFVEPFEDCEEGREGTWMAYRLTAKRQDWLLDNQDQLEMRLARRPAAMTPAPRKQLGISDDDVPF